MTSSSRRYFGPVRVWLDLRANAETFCSWEVSRKMEELRFSVTENISHVHTFVFAAAIRSSREVRKDQ